MITVLNDMNQFTFLYGQYPICLKISFLVAILLLKYVEVLWYLSETLLPEWLVNYAFRIYKDWEFPCLPLGNEADHGNYGSEQIINVLQKVEVIAALDANGETDERRWRGGAAVDHISKVDGML